MAKIPLHEIERDQLIQWSERNRGGYARYAGQVLHVLPGHEEFRVLLTRAGGTTRANVGDTIVTGFGGGVVYAIVPATKGRDE